MNSDLISVIVPVYKVESYLDRCVDSIANQTYRNLEIILVDDGSPDRCPEICDEWAQRDERVKVIHKTNGGVSSARNKGMESADGVWVSFVDADDYLPKTAFEDLMACYQKYDADLVCGSFRMMNTRNRIIDKRYQGRVIVREAFGENLSFLVNELHPACWAKLYDLRIIREHAVEFPLNIPSSEDAIFNYRYLCHCASVCTTAQNVYAYDFTRPGSAVKKYYEKVNQFVERRFASQKEFVQSIDGEYTEFLKEQERISFVSCLEYHAMHEKNKDKLSQKIQEAASLFPEAANHKLYGHAVQEQDWLRVSGIWKQKNLVLYLKETIKIYVFSVIRNGKNGQT